MQNHQKQRILSTHRAVNSALEHEAEMSQEVLYEATNTFPFILFPDTITIDRVKVTVTRRWFFGSSQVTSIQIQDILNIEANVGPVFGSLKIWTRFFHEEPLIINYLSRKDVSRIKCILQGYVIAMHSEIETSGVPKRELIQMLQHIGETSHFRPTT